MAVPTPSTDPKSGKVWVQRTGFLRPLDWASLQALGSATSPAGISCSGPRDEHEVPAYARPKLQETLYSGGASARGTGQLQSAARKQEVLPLCTHESHDAQRITARWVVAPTVTAASCQPPNPPHVQTQRLSNLGREYAKRMETCRLTCQDQSWISFRRFASSPGQFKSHDDSIECPVHAVGPDPPLVLPSTCLPTSPRHPSTGLGLKRRLWKLQPRSDHILMRSMTC